MKRNIIDYVHLHFGCDVVFKDEKHKIETYGEFNTAFITGVYQCPTGAGLIVQLCVDDWEEPIEPLLDEVKLVLRPLNDMTDAEKKEYWGLFKSYVSMIKVEADKVKFLLSKHLDVFDLIDAGFAIDKTKQ